MDVATLHLASDSLGLVTKSSFIVEHELGQKETELLRRTINVLVGRKTVSIFDVLLCRHDVTVTTKLLVKCAERSTKWCHSNDQTTGVNAVQHLKMLSSTAEQKASEALRVIYGSWCTRRIKK